MKTKNKKMWLICLVSVLAVSLSAFGMFSMRTTVKADSLQAPSEANLLTSGSSADMAMGIPVITVWNGGGGVFRMDGSGVRQTDGSFTYVDAQTETNAQSQTLASLGAKGSVAKIVTANSSNANFRSAMKIDFGRAITAEELNKGASMYIRIYAPDGFTTSSWLVGNDQTNVANSHEIKVGNYNAISTAIDNTATCFKNVVIHNQDLKDWFTVSDGSVPGFQFGFYSTNMTRTIYIDEVGIIIANSESQVLTNGDASDYEFMNADIKNDGGDFKGVLTQHDNKVDANGENYNTTLPASTTVGAKTLEQWGASGSVIRLQTSPTGLSVAHLRQTFTLKFAKTLTKAEIDAGAELYIRAFTPTTINSITSWVNKIGMVYPKNNDNAPTTGCYRQLIASMTTTGFTTIKISNQDLKDWLADSTGDFSGIQFVLYSRNATADVTSTIYIDEVFYATASDIESASAIENAINLIPATVTLEDKETVETARALFDGATGITEKILNVGESKLVKAEEQIKRLSVPEYTVNIDATKIDSTCYSMIMNRLPVSEGATKIIFEYTVVSSTGSVGSFGLARTSSVMSTNIISNYQGWYTSLAEESFKNTFTTVGNVYRGSLDMTSPNLPISSKKVDNLAAIEKIDANGEVTGFEYINNYKYSNGTPTNEYFGLYFGPIVQNSTSNPKEQRKDWKAQIKVRCYDDKGKDLQVTCCGAGITIENLLTLPTGTYTLTEGSASDSLAMKGSISHFATGIASNVISFNEDNYSYVTSEALTQLGANGSVIKITKGTGYAHVAIRFAKSISATEVENGAEMVVRMCLDPEMHDNIKYSNIFSMDKVGVAPNNDENRVLFNQMGVTNKNTTFVDARISNDKLKIIADADGSVSGLNFILDATATGSIYIDSVSYIPSAVTSVEKAISGLPATIALTDKTQVTTVSEAYEALGTEEKSLVSNLAKLTSAKDAIAQLEGELTAVQDVIDAITALPSTVTMADEDDVVSARTAYNALSSAQQANVTNLSVLESAETALAEIKSLMKDAKLDAINVALSGIIEMEFYFKLPDELVESSDAYALFTLNSVEKKVFLKDAVVDDGETYTRYMFSVEIPAAEMTLKVKSQIFDGKGNYNTAKEYSLKDYADWMIAKGTTEQAELVKAMLNYGAYAQIYFGVDVDNLANKDIFNESNPIENVSEVDFHNNLQGTATGFAFGSYDVSLEGATNMTVYFDLTDTDVSDYNIYLEYRADGETKSYSVTPVQDDDRYYVTINSIPSAYLDANYTIRVVYKDSTETRLITNPMCYVAYVLSNVVETNKVNLCKALYLYNVASNAYFNK